MWFLAWREIPHGRVRFGLTAALVGLVAFLVFMLTGLAVGLGDAGVSGLRRLPGAVVVYSAGAERVLTRSALPAADAARIAAVPGVTAVRPLGQTMAQAKGPNGAFPVALTGTDGAADGIVLDRTLEREAGIGQTVTLQPGGVRVRVAGFADLGSVQHTAVARVPLPVWRRTQPARPATGVYLVDTDRDPGATAAAITGAVAGTEAVTRRAAIDAVPGYAAETGTIAMIRGFLLAVSALLVGTVFWIFTMQKEASLAVLRATGARARLLVGSYLLQVAVTTVLGVAAGFAVVLGTGAAMPAGAFSLPGPAAALSAALLAALALAASAASLHRLLTVDPLLSLGRNA
ncbi:FtsX-like permease family protein [Actinomadura kijaniata]|uniref:FtsX-like permease family protein n=1 Tax=Actinomadura kijaniata TaxID=46161 RepID=UPI003F1D9837